MTFGRKITKAKKQPFGGGVVEKISAHAKNTQKCFQKNFQGADLISGFYSPVIAQKHGF